VIAGGLGDLIQAPLLGRARGIKVVAGPAEECVEDLREILNLTISKSFRPVIDSTWSFEEIPKAHARVQKRRKRGNVVITVE
jgi:NADPH:quinone reductase-like Zn-dependent oxidoreductase